MIIIIIHNNYVPMSMQLSYKFFACITAHGASKSVKFFLRCSLTFSVTRELRSVNQEFSDSAIGWSSRHLPQTYL